MLPGGFPSPVSGDSPSVGSPEGSGSIFCEMFGANRPPASISNEAQTPAHKHVYAKTNTQGVGAGPACKQQLRKAKWTQLCFPRGTGGGYVPAPRSSPIPWLPWEVWTGAWASEAVGGCCLRPGTQVFYLQLQGEHLAAFLHYLALLWSHPRE